MPDTDSIHGELSLQVENIGGISETDVTLSEGVTVLEGRNATNRTSFLQALMAAMGSDQYTLKGDAAAGRVELSLGDTVVERRFERRNGSVHATGAGYLDEPEVAELFAFLLEENPARRAVARGDNLHELLTRPIDTDEIEAEIELLQAEKRNIDDRLSSIEERERELVELERRKQELQPKVEEHETRLEDLEAEIEEADVDVAAERESRAAIEGQLDELKEHRTQLEDIRFELETIHETIASLETEREEKRDRREELAGQPDTDIDSLRAELADLRDRKREVNSQMNELQSIVQFNEEMLAGTDSEIAAVLQDAADEGSANSPTDRLLESDDTVTCWTCGSRVDRDDIEATLDRLRSLRQEKLTERKTIQEEIDETKDRVSSIETVADELDTLTERLAEIEVELEAKRERVTELETRRERLHDEIDELESAIEQDPTSNYDDVLQLHKQANRVELELEQLEKELESVESEIDEVESALADRQEYEDRRDQIVEELDELRTRIDRIEERAVSEFNHHMAKILELLEYENITRVWIDRRERETRRGRETVQETVFELHVVREADSGGAYEGTIDTLSESEREVVGLVVALAGYLVHDLHETVPIMLLDSLEAIDAARIAKVVEYFADYPEFLVVALLPEDAREVTAGQDIITDI
ncbi:archaea-specific SMC-related protein [Haloarchaeobius iranensis]|uniref:AAA domain-containing protein n=1 Tax=Haloarchaeobius iranensis TaxID=996166 RepID=A0A1G9YKI3_9EURY|nr:archaea-specific SMC-related protein [Haloarchaeobius iranensis]SDN09482.1 AAA domain-containing protein [Haloarchaeobius iranensis]